MAGEYSLHFIHHEKATRVKKRVEEVETPALLQAWIRTLELITALERVKLIPGHMEAGWELDTQADLAHTRSTSVCLERK